MLEKTVLVLLIAVAAGCGGTDDNTGVDGGDGGDGDGDGDITYAACDFPASFGPNERTFMCYPDDPIACTVSNPPAFTINVCVDSPNPELTFTRLAPGESTVTAPNGIFTSTSAGSITGVNRRIIGLPDASPITAEVTLGAVDYRLVFEFSEASQSVTIESFVAL